MQTMQLIASLLFAVAGVQALPQPEPVEIEARQTGGTIATINTYPQGGCTGTDTIVPIFGQIGVCYPLPAGTNAVSASTLTVSGGPTDCAVLYFTSTNCAGNFGDETTAIGQCTQASTSYKSVLVKCPP